MDGYLDNLEFVARDNYYQLRCGKDCYIYNKDTYNRTKEICLKNNIKFVEEPASDYIKFISKEFKTSRYYQRKKIEGNKGQRYKYTK